MDHTSNDPVTNALMGCPPENYILIAYRRGCDDTRQKHQKRIEQLEAALRQIIQEDALTGKTVFIGDFGKIARQALEKNDGPASKT